MSHAASEIISEIGAHIRKRGGVGHQWYVGIAADARDRLFSDHQVQKEGGVWIYRTANTHWDARQAEDHLVKQFGTCGGPSGGGAATRSVYAYKITAYTKQ